MKTIRSMKTINRITLLAAAMLLVLAACGSEPVGSSADGAGVKAGGGEAPIEITIADSQPRGAPSVAAALELATVVKEVSGGAMIVEVLTDFGGSQGTGSDEAVIRAVIDGETDLAIVPSRAWSSVAVDSLRPLQAPFLVVSEEHADAITADAEVVSSAFGGLDAVGVHGLAMFPEAMRHLFSFTEPILGLDDLVGRQVRIRSSDEVAAMVTALGAVPVDTAGDEYAAQVDSGTITAFDSSFSIANASNPGPAIATGNLVLYAKFQTVVANGEFWNGLSDEQRVLLADAVEQMRTWALAARPSEREAAALYCSEGGTVGLADASSVTTFRQAAAPLYDELRSKPALSATLDAIDELAPTTDAPGLEACGGPTSLVTYGNIVPDGGELPNGVYRVDFTEEYLRGYGLDELQVQNNRGVWTITLDDGRWEVDQVAPGLEDHWEGVYQVDGRVAHYALGQSEPILALSWSVDPDGTLHWVEIDAGDPPDWQFDVPWKRIGDG